MLKKIRIDEILLTILFLYTTFLSFVAGNLYYLSPKGPDFNYYKRYYDYFFGLVSTTNIEQGLLYYYLNSFLVSLRSEVVNKNNYIEFVSQAIQTTNLIFYLLGLLGVAVLLKMKNYQNRIILIVLILLNFFPQLYNARLFFKPEIVIFPMLVWTIVFIEAYLKKRKLMYLMFTVPPLAIIFTSKANLALMVFLYFSFTYLNKVYKFNRKNLTTVLLVFLIVFSILSFENYKENQLLIFEHVSPEEFTGKADLGYLVNLDINLLLDDPFRHSQKDSFIGVVLLDTFNDYFTISWNDDSSVYLYDSKNILNTKFKPYLSIMFTSIFYSLLIYFIFRNSKYKNFFIMPFFGIFVQMGLSQFTQYNPENGDVAKPYYYSFFLAISFAFLIAELLKKHFNISIVALFLFIILMLHILGFPKYENIEREKFISFNNEISPTCSLNNHLFKELDSDCVDYSDLNCDTLYDSLNKVIIVNSEFINKNYLNNDSVVNLIKNKETKEVKSYEECRILEIDGWLLSKKFVVEKTPIFNLLTFVLYVFSSIFFSYKLLFRKTF